MLALVYGQTRVLSMCFDIRLFLAVKTTCQFVYELSINFPFIFFLYFVVDATALKFSYLVLIGCSYFIRVGYIEKSTHRNYKTTKRANL